MTPKRAWLQVAKGLEEKAERILPNDFRAVWLDEQPAVWTLILVEGPFPAEIPDMAVVEAYLTMRLINGQQHLSLEWRWRGECFGPEYACPAGALP
jgi:hypothetical protein